jgi:hypothetical protein
MKKRITVCLLTLLLTFGASAQVNLTGRVYSNPNIMTGMFNDFEKKVTKEKSKAIAKAEKKKGRKLTEAEKKELDEKIQKEVIPKLETMRKGMVIGITVTFKSANELEMKNNTKISDEALKVAGVSWLKRKAMRAALAVAPKTEKSPYTVKGNLIIYGEGKDLDTLKLSDDGKKLYGEYRKKDNFELNRTK